MRCATCQFENIPGQSRCIRCGSVLEMAGGAVPIHPPRMPAWRGPFRTATRQLRSWRLLPSMPKIPWVRKVSDALLSDGLFGLVLSLVPGLAHLLHGRFKEVRWLVLAWFTLLCAGLFLYGSAAGMILIGVAIGVHAWIAVQYGLFNELTGLAERVVAVVLILIALGLLYHAAPGWVAPDLTGGYTALLIPATNTRPGDYFAVRPLADPNAALPRGTLVLVRPGGFTAQGGRYANLRNLMIGQIVGLPGETIHILNRTYVVDGQVLDPNRFPVPRWLHPYPFASGALVPEDSYFISTEYTIHAYANVRPTDAMIRNACTFQASDIRGRAFLRWWPLQRREFIE